ncbi:MAG: YraN family protein [Clostridia bacterium]|nr:YraN family protein [Clostridia bacterium]
MGVLGERAAADYLTAHGFTIRERNFRSRFGEIDIIATKGPYLCFVEVKTRGARAIARPAASVTAAKQRKIRLTAEYYIARHRTLLERSGLQPRFDVAEVYADAAGLSGPAVRYMENAFD